LPGEQARLETDDMAAKFAVVDYSFAELKIRSLHGNPFCGAGVSASA
jgi:hypothetical protein